LRRPAEPGMTIGVRTSRMKEQFTVLAPSNRLRMTYTDDGASLTKGEKVKVKEEFEKEIKVEFVSSLTITEFPSGSTGGGIW
jgi:hypothetical protein